MSNINKWVFLYRLSKQSKHRFKGTSEERQLFSTPSPEEKHSTVILSLQERFLMEKKSHLTLSTYQLHNLNNVYLLVNVNIY